MSVTHRRAGTNLLLCWAPKIRRRERHFVWQEVWGAVMTAKREVYVLKRVRTSGECMDIMQRLRKLSYSSPCRYLQKLRSQGLV